MILYEYWWKAVLLIGKCYLALPLKADVARPLHEPRQVHLRLESIAGVITPELSDGYQAERG